MANWFRTLGNRRQGVKPTERSTDPTLQLSYYDENSSRHKPRDHYALNGGLSHLTGAQKQCIEELYDRNADVKTIFNCISGHLSRADTHSPLPFRRVFRSYEPYLYGDNPVQLSRKSQEYLYDWPDTRYHIISQNSSSRKVYRYLWKACPEDTGMPVAVKLVADSNTRDGRSLKREIECHLYVHQKLDYLFEQEKTLWNQQSSIYSFGRMSEWHAPIHYTDAWPCSEMLGFKVDKNNPGQSIMVTRKLSGPDFFDVIRSEHSHQWNYHNSTNSNQVKCSFIYNQRTAYNNIESQARSKHGLRLFGELRNMKWITLINSDKNACEFYPAHYDYHKLRWAAITLKRLSQFHSINVRHNDIKPDNIVCDFYEHSNKCMGVDVKLIDLGTASLGHSRDFTGGTSWYESPEQKLLEYFGKRMKDYDASKKIDIGLSSDLWGAGVSLTEMLLGRRVVDYLKAPDNIGPLEYTGFTDGLPSLQTKYRNICCSRTDDVTDYLNDGGALTQYPFWKVSPDVWVDAAKVSLFKSLEGTSPLVVYASEWLYDNLVRYNPAERKSINMANDKVEQYAEEQYRRIRHEYTSFQGRVNGYGVPRKQNRRVY